MILVSLRSMFCACSFSKLNLMTEVCTRKFKITFNQAATMECWRVFILQATVLYCCNADSYIVVVDRSENHGPVAEICEKCEPGYEASWRCRDALYSHTHVEVNRSSFVMNFQRHIVRRAPCWPCSRKTFSEKYEVNQTCKRCSVCPPGKVVYENCTSKSDTVCRFSAYKTATSKQFPMSRTLQATTYHNISTKSTNTFQEQRSSTSKLNNAMLSVALGILFLILVSFGYLIYLWQMRTRRARSNDLQYFIRRRSQPRELRQEAIDCLNVQSVPSLKDYWQYDEACFKTTSTVLSMEVGDSHTEPYGCNLKSNLSSPEPEDGKEPIFDNFYGKTGKKYPSSSVFEEVDPTLNLFSALQNQEPINSRPSTRFISRESSVSFSREPHIQGSYPASLRSDVSLPTQSRDSNFWSRSSSWSDSESDQVGKITITRSRSFGAEGGRWDIDGTSVSIKVPKGAISKEERKEIEVSVHICRPSDWKKLRENNETIELPQVELGPSGATFAKPIEVILKNSPSDEPNEMVFEFTQNDVLSTDAIWQPALKCQSRKEAKKIAMNVAPNVAYFAGHENLHVFYLHFTGGRKKMKNCKYKWMQAKAFLRVEDALGLSIMLKAVFFEATPEGEQMLKKETEGFVEVQVTKKSIKILNEKKFEVQTHMKIYSNEWTTEETEAACSFDCIFDPKYLGGLPVVDFVLLKKTEDVADLHCTVDILKMKVKDIDLKVLVSKGKIRELLASRFCMSQSSGYLSVGQCNNGVHVIDDADFKNAPPREYIRQVNIRLSKHVASVYKAFTRELGIDDCAIATAAKDHPGDSGEACYSLLRKWLDGHNDGPNFKKEMLDKLENALKSTSTACVVSLPGNEPPEKSPEDVAFAKPGPSEKPLHVEARETSV